MLRDMLEKFNEANCYGVIVVFSVNGKLDSGNYTTDYTEKQLNANILSWSVEVEIERRYGRNYTVANVKVETDYKE